MNAKHILGSAMAVAIVAASAAALAAPANSKVGKFDVYADALRVGKPDPFTDGGKAGKFDPYADGAKQGKFDTYTDGAKQGKFDTYTDGARAFSGEIAAISLDNSRSGDGTLYGYRVGTPAPGGGGRPLRWPPHSLCHFSPFSLPPADPQITIARGSLPPRCHPTWQHYPCDSAPAEAFPASILIHFTAVTLLLSGVPHETEQNRT